MDEHACLGYRELLQRVAEFEAQVAELTRKLDDALRAGKRQAAPFRNGPPKPDPKTPGRKSGDAHGKHGHRRPISSPSATKRTFPTRAHTAGAASSRPARPTSSRPRSPASR